MKKPTQEAAAQRKERKAQITPAQVRLEAISVLEDPRPLAMGRQKSSCVFWSCLWIIQSLSLDKSSHWEKLGSLQPGGCFLPS